MSDDFIMPEYVRRFLDRRDRPLFMPSLYGKSNDEEDSGTVNDLPFRYLPHSPPITSIRIRQIRHIPAIPAAPTVHSPAAVSAIVVHAVRSFSHKSRTSPYWQDSGWEKRGDSLIGHYRAGNRQFPGSIDLKDSVVTPAVYHIYDPPQALLSGPHQFCFNSEGEVAGRSKYWIHFSEEPADIDSGIIQIQRDLSTAIGAR